ncbi:PLC-like phosphodiesterase [Gyrodon lividus]|nr:PLC-like phosphodiesterase [Gyrodon lividus]
MQTQTPDQLNGIAGKASMADVPVPSLLQQGVPMTKVSAKSQKSYIFKLDADQGQIIWESKKLRIIPIENIKELRSGSDARYYRQQFQLAQEYEDRWITIIYMLDGQYKTLHLIASSRDSFQLWDITLKKLYAIRQELMTGLGNDEIRQAVWIKQCWKSSNDQNDQKLSFDQAEKLCRRLNINSSQEDLMRLFRRADSQSRSFLDFADFQTFVKLLKARPELDLLYKKLCSETDGKFTFNVFENFMRDVQKSTLKQAEVKNLFARYVARTPEEQGSRSIHSIPSQSSPSQPVCPPQPLPALGARPSTPDVDNLTMSLDGFTAFLLSLDNSAFTDQNQPMTYPLSDYFISSSHNTYLVGHQLVGDSTIEGYIRALLHSCRSVECTFSVDIYDGEHEPMVFHGKTFTSKVPVREVCEAIAKYAFVTSPYPIIISAEIHCSLPQQDMLVAIMHEVFGTALVAAPIEGRQTCENLPSPEDLKGRVLLKAKNLYVSESETMRQKDVSVDTESSSTETSASDSDIVHEIKDDWKKAKLRDMEAVKELKEEFRKARNVFNRVRRRHQSPERSVTAALISTATATSTAVIEQPVKSESKHDTKAKMSPAVVALLVYTVGVKCRGINKKEHYAPEHVFSLSETTANKILKQGVVDLIKHNRTHLVRIYPKGLRVNSTNYLPHRYWAAGAHLVAINWQTFDLGYMINHAMFQRNGRAGYVLKPDTLRKTDDLRKSDKEQLSHRTSHYLEVTIISAQQLPRPKDAMGHETMDKNVVDPYVEVSIHTPDWGHPGGSSTPSASSSSSSSSGASHRPATMRTSAVKNNGFNPVWQERLRLPFECVGNMKDLIFVRFTVQRDGEHDDEPVAVYCVSLGSLAMGYRHLPLHDSQLSQYLFSTLFVKCSIYDA